VGRLLFRTVRQMGVAAGNARLVTQPLLYHPHTDAGPASGGPRSDGGYAQSRACAMPASWTAHEKGTLTSVHHQRTRRWTKLLAGSTAGNKKTGADA